MTKKNKIVFHFMKIYILLCICFSLSSCQKNTSENSSRQKLIKKLDTLKRKTPNEIYDILGEPNEYNAVINKNHDIIKGIIAYRYLYNFKTKKYGCEIRFITDKEQEEIVDYEYSSEECYSVSINK